jgi:hypothetical protein
MWLSFSCILEFPLFPPSLRLRSHLRAHVDLFLELNLLRSTIVHNNAIQRAAPSSPPNNAILFAVSPAKNCVYSQQSASRHIIAALGS